MKYLYTICALFFTLLTFSNAYADMYEPTIAPCDSNNVFSFDIRLACKDGIANDINLMNNINGTVGTNHAYLVADTNDVIVLSSFGASSYDIDQLSPDTYRIYGVSYQGSLTLFNGMSVSSISASNCVKLSSNFIEVTVYASPPTAFAGEDMILCGGAAVQLDGNAPLIGTGTWTQISGANTANIINPNQANSIVINLTTGIYQFEWSISNPGICPPSSDTLQVEILDGSSFQIDTIYTTNETCYEDNDGSATIEVIGATGPITYELGTQTEVTNNNTYTFSLLSAGTYPVMVKDSSGCAALTANVTITEPDSLYVSTTAMGESQVGAADGSIGICVQGGTPNYAVTISPTATVSDLGTGACDGNFEVNDLSPDDYIITIQDENGCTITDGITIAPGNCSTAIDSVVVNNGVSCHGESDGKMTIYASGTNGFEFSTDGGATYDNSNSSSIVYAGLTGGNYDIIVRDDIGCTDTFHLNPIVIPEPADFLITLLTSTDVSMPGASDGEIGFCLNGGMEPYAVTYTGNNNSTSGSFIDTEGNCGGDFVATGLPGDTYTINITDANNCSTTFDVVINNIDCSMFAIDNVEVVDILCNGDNTGSISISTSGGFAPYSFTLNNGITTNTMNATVPNTTFTGLAAGSYTITATHSNECTEVYTMNPVVVTEPATISAASSTNNPTTIDGTDGEICITPTGGIFPYTVTADCGTVITGSGNCGGNFHINGLEEGICNIQITDANDCSYVVATTLADPSCSSFVLANVMKEDVACAGESNATITVSVNGGEPPYQYSTDGGMNFIGNTNSEYTFSGLVAGSYNVVVQDNQDCPTAVMVVQIDEPDALNVQAAATATCTEEEEGGIDITVTGGTSPYTYQWDTNQIDEDIDQLEAGTYMLTVTDNNACTEIATVQITEHPVITVDAGADLVIELGDSIQINTTITATQNYTFEWSPIGGLINPSSLTPLANPIATTSYTLTVTSDEGCIYTDKVSIGVNTPRDLIAIPSAFTPNGDGENDELEIFLQGGNQLVAFYVFNRWGEEIFYTENENEGWNGTYKSQDQPVGTYVYLLQYTNSAGSQTKGGDVTLLR